MAATRKRLGKGLDALLTARSTKVSVSSPETVEKQVSEALAVDDAMPDSQDKIQRIPVEFIQPGQYQPRRDIDKQGLEELAASIRSQGMLQPIVIRGIGKNKYEIIAGERRWRACQLVGMDRVPSIIRELDDHSTIALSLIENIQREDLNPVEEALALHRLQDEFSLTQQQVAEAVGKSRAAVANLLRLLNLKEEVMRLLEHGDIEVGHAKVLLSLKGNQQAEAAEEVVNKGLSVRQTEQLVKNFIQKNEISIPNPIAKIDPDISRFEEDLADRLGARVKIQHSAKGSGKLIIFYDSVDELDGLNSRL